MHRTHIWIASGALALSCLVLPGSMGAQELHNYAIGVFGGIGGSFDVEPDAGLDNEALQLSFSMVTSSRTLFVARVGELDFTSEGFALFSEADLTYLTLGGEYRSRRSFYDSGLYFALGGYRLEGITSAGLEDEDTALGLAIGSTADFPINRWLSIQAELSGHFTDLDDAQFFGMLHIGASVKF
ncbi:MAG: hypothetical protein K0U98_13500 [Deltaproteobacteria bacterium]|nr:hypothetical protein [Deltaproteobacteria bacterium]